VQTLIQPTVGTLQVRPTQRREREITDAMEVVLEETLYKNMQLQRDVESLGAQCVRLRRLLAESYQQSAPQGNGSTPPPARAANAPAPHVVTRTGDKPVEPGARHGSTTPPPSSAQAQPGMHWEAVAGGRHT
jgi:hypothetical protein